MRRRRFKSFLLRNTCAIAVPVLVLLVFLMFIILNFPVVNNVRNIKVEATDELLTKLEKLYIVRTVNISYEATDLYYTGFDYKRDGKIAGAYYYNIDEQGINLFLIKENGTPKEHYDKKLIKGQIIKNEIMAEYILGQYAADTDVDETMLADFYSSYIISEPDYPYAYIILIYAIIFIPIVASVLIIVYTIFIWLMPSIHPQSRQLEEYGNIKAVIKDINKELTNHLLFRKNNIYVTENYLIINYLTRTDVVKLDLIKYMSKNEVEIKGALGRTQLAYRLTMSNPEKLFYEVDFASEELADTVVEYIIGKKDS